MPTMNKALGSSDAHQSRSFSHFMFNATHTIVFRHLIPYTTQIGEAPMARVIDAVECAVAIQRIMALRSDQMPRA
jgi:hypothetical protein